jgi:tetratricopeptide (TPR) repeat protein
MQWDALLKLNPFCVKAMAIRKALFEENHPDYANSLKNLATLYYAMGRFADAEFILHKVVEIHQVKLGENHLDYASSLNNLALLYYAYGEDLRKRNPFIYKQRRLEKSSWEKIIPTMPPV